MKGLTVNRKDRLYPLASGFFHDRCLEAHPLFHTATRMMAAVREHFDTACACEVCAELEILIVPRKPLVFRIVDEYPPAAMLTTGHATSNPQSPLWNFNFRCVHPEHVPDWVFLSDYVAAIRDATVRGEWQRTPWQKKTLILPAPA